jgi:isoquinoline 1-oxidoreductase alpha subunit
VKRAAPAGILRPSRSGTIFIAVSFVNRSAELRGQVCRWRHGAIVSHVTISRNIKIRWNCGLKAALPGPGKRDYPGVAAAAKSGSRPQDCCSGEVRKMIRLKVNGVERSFDDDPTMPLLWYLRDELALTGTKFGCGISLCGACTVHLNGKPVRSCVTQMRQLENAEITTIEGISAKGPHAVQRAWMQLNVPQCGYCQSGQIMSAVALLRTNRSPSDQQIDEAMSGNICRCGTYQRIRAAIKAAAEASREHD